MQGRGDLLAAGDLTDTFRAGGIGQDDDISGEIGCVRTGEIQLHAVMSGYGIYFHLCDNGGIMGTVLLYLSPCFTFIWF